MTVADVPDGDSPAQLVHVDGRLSPDQAALIEDGLWSQQPELQRLLPGQVGQFPDGDAQRRRRPLALTQLLIAYHVLRGRLDHELMTNAAERGARLVP